MPPFCGPSWLIRRTMRSFARNRARTGNDPLRISALEILMSHSRRSRVRTLNECTHQGLAEVTLVGATGEV